MRRISGFLAPAALAILAAMAGAAPVQAETAAEINRDVDRALAALYKEAPAARAMQKKAKAILVFPKVVKGGLLVGGQYGEGALRRGEKTVDYYSTVAVTYGLQAGGQQFGYAMFFMSDSALDYLEESEGWEVGTGPSVVVMDDGMASSMTTTSYKDDVYVYFFAQEGLMLGLGLQGTKITKIQPDG